MKEKIPIETLEKCRDYYSSQEGRKYPCSNQTVICGIFTSDRNKAINFMKDKNFVKAKKEIENAIIWYLSNNEQWVWKNWNDTQIYRSYRFYKVAVDKDINPEIFECLVLPCASFYCCSFEII